MADLPAEMVLWVARERAETLGAAVDAIERHADADGEIMHQLRGYMIGGFGLAAVQYALKRAGIEPGRGNVVPLFPRGRASP